MLPGYQIPDRGRLYAGFQPEECEGLFFGKWTSITTHFQAHAGFRGKGFGLSGALTITDSDSDMRSTIPFSEDFFTV